MRTSFLSPVCLASAMVLSLLLSGGVCRADVEYQIDSDQSVLTLSGI